jgi:hypothetical protein
MLLTISLINLFAWLIACWFFFFLRRIPFYHPTTFYLVYHFLGFVARPFVASYSESNLLWEYIGFSAQPSDLLFSCLATNMALLAFTGGTYLAINGSRMESSFSLRSFIINNKTFFFTACLLIGLTSLYATKINNIGEDFTNPVEVEIDESGGQKLVGVSGYRTAIENFAIGLFVMLCLLFNINIPLVAIITPWIFLRMWIGTGRWNFILPVLIMVALNTWWSGRRWPKLKLIVPLALILLVFNILGGNREAFRLFLSGEYSLKEILKEHNELRGQEYGLSDFQEFDLATFIYSVVPEKTGWNYGTQYLRLLVWPIPRQIWPEKPVFTSRINFENLGNVYGLSFPMHADFYSVYGIPTLVLGMGLVGYFLQSLYTKALTTKNVYVFAAYWIFLMETPQWFRDGGVTIVFFFSFIYLPVLICLWIGKVNLSFRTLQTAAT